MTKPTPAPATLPATPTEVVATLPTTLTGTVTKAHELSRAGEAQRVEM